MEKPPDIIETTEWRCAGCKALLGFVENKKIVRIKRKDLYLQVEEGRITVNCCRCGKPNTLVDDKINVGKEVNINGL